MNPPPDIFSWSSKTGAAVILFLIAGAVHLLIGAFTPIVLRTMKPNNILLLSERSDSAAYGRSSGDWMSEEPALREYRNVVFHVIGGLLVATGAMEILLAWFGVRGGMTWALAALAFVGASTILFWALALMPYFQVHAPLGLGDLPPFMWIPSLAYPPAVLLAWWGRFPVVSM